MRTNPFYDAWLFLIGQTDDHRNSGVGPLLVGLFLALLIGSIWIARRNWQEDPSQRTREHLATWIMRIMIGCMWFQGSLWKLPLPVSGGFKYWTEELSRYAAFGWHKWLATEVFLPLLPLINPLVYLAELLLGVAFILGFFLLDNAGRSLGLDALLAASRSARSLVTGLLAVSGRDPLVFWARSLPLCDSLRAHPRFKEIMRGVWE